jgi:hypothetical protein
MDVVATIVGVVGCGLIHVSPMILNVYAAQNGIVAGHVKVIVQGIK